MVVFEAPMDAIVSRDERERGVKKDFIKRAVGLPGDMIEVKNKHLFVNGVQDTNPFPVYKDPFTYPAALPGVADDRISETLGKRPFSPDLQRSQIGDNFGPIKVPPDSYFVMGDNRDGSFDSRFWGPLPLRLLKGKAWIVYWPPQRLKVDPLGGRMYYKYWLIACVAFVILEILPPPTHFFFVCMAFGALGGFHLRRSSPVSFGFHGWSLRSPRWRLRRS